MKFAELAQAQKPYRGNTDVDSVSAEGEVFDAQWTSQQFGDYNHVCKCKGHTVKSPAYSIYV